MTAHKHRYHDSSSIRFVKTTFYEYEWGTGTLKSEDFFKDWQFSKTLTKAARLMPSQKRLQQPSLHDSVILLDSFHRCGDWEKWNKVPMQ